MIALKYHDNCCGLADPLTPLAAAALPDGVPMSAAARKVSHADPHTVFDGHRSDFWTGGRPGRRDVEVCIESARADGAISVGLVVNGLDCSGVPIDQALSLADARGDAGVCGVSCRGGGHLKAS